MALPLRGRFSMSSHQSLRVPFWRGRSHKSRPSGEDRRRSIPGQQPPQPQKVEIRSCVHDDRDSMRLSRSKQPFPGQLLKVAASAVAGTRPHSTVAPNTRKQIVRFWARACAWPYGACRLGDLVDSGLAILLCCLHSDKDSTASTSDTFGVFFLAPMTIQQLASLRCIVHSFIDACLFPAFKIVKTKALNSTGPWKKGAIKRNHCLKRVSLKMAMFGTRHAESHAWLHHSHFPVRLVSSTDCRWTTESMHFPCPASRTGSNDQHQEAHYQSIYDLHEHE